MILKKDILEVVEKQKEKILSYDKGLLRNFVYDDEVLNSQIMIISGIRRSGKSTLMLQIMEKLNNKNLYVNFESPKLYGFEMNDFSRLDNIIQENRVKYLFFDEIQIIDGWEIYLREKLDEKYKIIVSGSNASLLSRELGTKLTGRHISKELFPFSYDEYLKFYNLNKSNKSLESYMNDGGFPEYLKYKSPDYLNGLFDDILIRDIVVRYNIKDSTSLKKLSLLLISNVGKRVTATKLKQPLSVSSTSTIMNWFSYLENSWLFFFVPVYSYSVKAQMINSRKVYAVDTGIIKSVSLSASEDYGRIFENLVFLHIRKKYKDIYYYDNNGECDFVVFLKNKVIDLIQVCYDLNNDNVERELRGLINAMNFFNIKNGKIITFDQEDIIYENNLKIEIIPAHKFLK